MEVLKAHLVRVFIAEEDIVRVEVSVNNVFVMQDLNEVDYLNCDVYGVIF